MNADVLEKFESLPDDIKAICLAVRRIAYDVAAKDARIGPLTETLKWGEPAYLTNATKAGTTLRVWRTKDGVNPAIFVNCRTSLVQHFRDIYPQTFEYRDNRAVVLGLDISNKLDALEHCIQLTLTYNLWK